MQAHGEQRPTDPGAVLWLAGALSAVRSWSFPTPFFPCVWNLSPILFSFLCRRVLACVAHSTDRVPRTKIAESFMRRMNDFLRGSDVNRIEVAGLALSNMLRCDASDVYKHVFFNMQGYDT